MFAYLLEATEKAKALANQASEQATLFAQKAAESNIYKQAKVRHHAIAWRLSLTQNTDDQLGPRI